MPDFSAIIDKVKTFIPGTSTTETNTSVSISVPSDNPGGFWSDGFPGWFFPTVFSLHVATVAILASCGNTTADSYLTKHWVHETEWMGVIFAPWLGFKGFKSWHRTKERIAAKTPAIMAVASPNMTATATAADGDKPATASISTTGDKSVKD